MDYSQLIQDSRQLLAEGKVQSVIDKLASVCQTNKVPFELHTIYVQALLSAQQYREAYQEALHYEPQYQQDRQSLNLWIEILIKNGLFIPARIALTHFKNQSDANQQFNQIENAENQIKRNQPETIKQKLRNFYHIGDQKLWQQRTSLADADELPLSDYLTGAQFALRDPFAKPIIRSAILQTLSDLKIAEPIKFIWIDGQTYQIIPSKIQDLMEMDSVNQSLKILNNKLGHNDPIAYQNAMNRFKLQCLIIYPFVNQTIKNPEVWVAALLNDSAGINLRKFQEASKTQRLIASKLR